jgi:hypothetical protein
MKSFYAAIQIGNKLELEQQECRLQIFFTNNARHSFHNLNLDEEKFNWILKLKIDYYNILSKTVQYKNYFLTLRFPIQGLKQKQYLLPMGLLTVHALSSERNH